MRGTDAAQAGGEVVNVGGGGNASVGRHAAFLALHHGLGPDNFGVIVPDDDLVARHGLQSEGWKEGSECRWAQPALTQVMAESGNGP